MGRETINGPLHAHTPPNHRALRLPTVRYYIPRRKTPVGPDGRTMGRERRW